MKKKRKIKGFIIEGYDKYGCHTFALQGLIKRN
jgi:hypothetical protein